MEINRQESFSILGSGSWVLSTDRCKSLAWDRSCSQGFFIPVKLLQSLIERSCRCFTFLRCICLITRCCWWWTHFYSGSWLSLCLAIYNFASSGGLRWGCSCLRGWGVAIILNIFCSNYCLVNCGMLLINCCLYCSFHLGYSLAFLVRFGQRSY
jgi:hypothetical protein